MAARYDYADAAIRAWLEEPIRLPEEGQARVAELVHETPQQRHWWPTFPTRRSQAMFSAPRLVAAAVFVALLGGSLMAGLLPARPEHEAPAAATATDAPSSTPLASPSPDTPLPDASATSMPTTRDTATQEGIVANSRLIDTYTKRLDALLAKRQKSDDDRAEMLSLTTLISSLRAENVRFQASLESSSSPEPSAAPTPTPSPSAPPDTATEPAEPMPEFPGLGIFDALDEESAVIYRVRPDKGLIDVSVLLTLETLGQKGVPSQEWGPLVIEDRPVRPEVGPGFKRIEGPALPGPWKETWLETPKIEGGGNSRNTVLRYRINARPNLDETRKADTPARVDESYIYFCVVGQDTDRGSVTVRIDKAKEWRLTQSGTRLEATSSGFKSGMSRVPREIFTCFEGTRDDELETDTFVGPADRPVSLQAWAKDPPWLVAADNLSKPVLDEIHRFLGHDIPGSGPVVIREAPDRVIGGYASAHDTPGVVQLDERGGTEDAEHQLAHAWFGTDNFNELWLREAMAEWTATAMPSGPTSGEVCAAVGPNTLGLDLSDWQVVQPTSGADYEEIIAAQELAACGIVSAVAERMPEELWLEVIGSMLAGETKYIGSAGPEIGVSAVVDYREWLDAVDERGLIPAAADPAYSADLEDLDFAQDLLDEYGIPSSAPELAARAEARAYYHQFLADAPIGAPHVVRKAMDDWRFADATAALDTAYEVYQALTEADELLPTTNLIPIIQPRFEAARSEEELEAVGKETFDLLEGATSVFGPLGDPTGVAAKGAEDAERAWLALGLLYNEVGDWQIPPAVTNAVEQGQIRPATLIIEDARAVISAAKAADVALPQAELRAEMQPRFEVIETGADMAALREDAETRRAEAETVGDALNTLNTLVPTWQLPSVVADPVDAGDFATAAVTAAAALKWIQAAYEADQDLPELRATERIKPSFEGATSLADLEEGAALVESWAEAAYDSALEPDIEVLAEKAEGQEKD